MRTEEKITSLSTLRKAMDTSDEPQALVLGNGEIVFSNKSFASYFHSENEYKNILKIFQIDEKQFEKYIQDTRSGIPNFLKKEDLPGIQKNVSLGRIFCSSKSYILENSFLLRVEDNGKINEIIDNLTEAELRFKSMADSSPVLLWLSREDSLCTFFNQTWLDFTGRSLNEEWGVGWAEGIHPEDFQESMDVYQEAFSSKSRFEMTYRLRRHDGVYRYLLDRGIPRYTLQKKFVGFIGSCVDITERIEAFALLEANDKKLKALNVKLNQFTSLAAHDLREPARRITAVAEILKDDHFDGLSTEGREYVTILAEESKRMVALISDLKFLSGVGNEMPQSKEKVDITEICNIVLETYRDKISARRAKVIIAVHPPLIGISSLIKMLYQRLIANAFLYSTGDLQIDFTHDNGIYGIRNSGSTISENQLARVIEPFIRGTGSHGSGFGLYICRQIVEIHGGKLWIESGSDYVHVKFKFN